MLHINIPAIRFIKQKDGSQVEVPILIDGEIVRKISTSGIETREIRVLDIMDNIDQNDKFLQAALEREKDAKQS